MAGLHALLCSVPDGYGILFTRLVLLILSIASLAVYGTTITTYNTRVVSPGTLTPSADHYPLHVNVAILIPSALSSIWAITHLSFLARKLLQMRRRQGHLLTTNASTGREIWHGRRPLIHPGWTLAADAICWVFFVVLAVLSGVEANSWKNGTIDSGSNGTRQNVVLSACPTFDPATGLLDYWCTQAWDEVVGVTNSGTSILGTLAGIYFSRALFACFELYIYRRNHGKRLLGEDTTARPAGSTQDVELEQK